LAKFHGASDAEVQEAAHFAKYTAGWSSCLDGTLHDHDRFVKELKETGELLSEDFMKNTVYVIVVLAFVFTAIGCDVLDLMLFEEGRFVFINNSSYDLTIEPNGQMGWVKFLLPSDRRRTVRIEDEQIYFVYSPAPPVEVALRPGTFTFSDADSYLATE
jgi:hypothetical protein